MVPDKVFYTAVTFFLATILAVGAFSARGSLQVVATNLENIPMVIGGYLGVDDAYPEGVYAELNADKHVYRHYRAADREKIDLYIGYYGTAKGGRTGHNPYACLPGSGWGIVDDHKVLLNSPHPSGTYWHGSRINRLLAQKGGSYAVMFHWYQSAGTKVLATGIQQNIQRFRGRLLHGRNDGAYVQITLISDEGGLAEAQQRGELFVTKILDLLPLYWPEEK